jgi:hypothetical protein
VCVTGSVCRVVWLPMICSRSCEVKGVHVNVGRYKMKCFSSPMQHNRVKRRVIIIGVSHLVQAINQTSVNRGRIKLSYK